MQLPVVDTGTTILTTAGYLCLLLGVIYLAYYLMKRFGLHAGGGMGAMHGPRLLSRLMLGNRQSVAVVRYKDRELVLGVTEERITLLTESEADGSETPPAPKANFAKMLKRSADDED